MKGAPASARRPTLPGARYHDAIGLAADAQRRIVAASAHPRRKKPGAGRRRLMRRSRISSPACTRCSLRRERLEPAAGDAQDLFAIEDAPPNIALGTGALGIVDG